MIYFMSLHKLPRALTLDILNRFNEAAAAAITLIKKKKSMSFNFSIITF